MRQFTAILCVLIFVFACEHDPFPAPPDSGGIEHPPISKPCHPDTIYFERDILPILNSNCAYSGCHDAGTASDGVILDSYSNVLSTADVDAFDPDGSDFYQVLVDTDPSKRMPFGLAALPGAQIQIIRTWIEQGALNLSCDDCDTALLTYNTGIKAIIDLNCGNCHGSVNPSGGRSLTTYSELVDAVQNTNLLQRINNEPGVPVMPPAGPIGQCSLDQIAKWHNNGMPE